VALKFEGEGIAGLEEFPGSIRTLKYCNIVQTKTLFDN